MPEQDYKRCTKCGESKPLDEFYRDSARKDGRRADCKACGRARASAWRRANPERKLASKKRWEDRNREKVRAKGRARARANSKAAVERVRRWRKNNPEKVAEQERLRRERYPEKYRARTAVGNALRDGRLVRPDRCTSCNEPTGPRRLHAHHEDYSKPLTVEWLCHSCHQALHDAVAALKRALPEKAA